MSLKALSPFAARIIFTAILVVTLTDGFAAKFRENKNPTPGDLVFDEYFARQTATLSKQCLTEIKTADDWKRKAPQYRKQLFEMLGLDPLPPKNDLKATITGTVDHPEFTVENLHYQSLPGFYVTANLYIPKGLTKPAPAIIYVCGHGRVKKGDVSYGNKTHYQHHGAWFARNGYVCMVIDTVQLGELEGIHHGTYREKMWWWNSRGYSSAATEAWNCIRALDYLETRKEVDKNRFGVTGRSGGGAYSWWIAALDERIKAAAPVAGITDLWNHVVDGCVEGHCDCMYHVNTYRWDFAQIAALVAPRPLLLCNTDDDRIFPLDGVTRLYQQVKRIYELNGARANLGLVITPGPHKDTQELRIPVFNWFNKHLKGEQPFITMPAEKLFEPEQLRVLKEAPDDERTTTIYESFATVAKDDDSPDAKELLSALRQKVFRGWPRQAFSVDAKTIATTEHDGISLRVIEFTSEAPFRLRAYVAQPVGVEPKALHLEVIDEEQWSQQLALATVGFAPAFTEEFKLAGVDTNQPVSRRMQQAFGGWVQYIKGNQSAYVTLTVRGIGNTTLNKDERHRTQVRRRFMLLGQTLDGMRVYDVTRAVDALRLTSTLTKLPLHLWARDGMANSALLASLFIKDVEKLHLTNLAMDDHSAPDYLNLSRIATWPTLVTLARQSSEVEVKNKGEK